MAKILDKLAPSSAQRIIKLRQSCDWIKIELSELQGIYDAKKQKTLDKFIAKANKRLASAAYLACDKREYADNVMAQKLQEYDVKNYLSHRAVHHKAAKAIFKAIKENQSYASAIDILSAEEEKLSADRSAFVKKLLDERDAFVSRGGKSDPSQYDALRREIEKEYAALSDSIDEKHSQIIAKKRQALESRLESLTSELNGLLAAQTVKHKLCDDVLLSPYLFSKYISPPVAS